LEAFPTIRLQKITNRKFYRRLQGIYKRFYRRIPRGILEGLKVEKWWKMGAKDQRDVLRCLKFTKEVSERKLWLDLFKRREESL